MTTTTPIPVFQSTDKPLMTTTEVIAMWENRGRRGQIQSSAVQVKGDGRVGALQSRYTSADGVEMFTISPPQTDNDELLGWSENALTDWPAHCLRPIDLCDVVDWLIAIKKAASPLTTADIKALGIHPRTALNWGFVAKRVYMMKPDHRLDVAMYAIEWAMKTGRASTAVAKAIEGMTAYQFGKLLLEVANLGMKQNDVPRWLNSKFV